jgi:hypothetical protein
MVNQSSFGYQYLNGLIVVVDGRPVRVSVHPLVLLVVPCRRSTRYHDSTLDRQTT